MKRKIRVVSIILCTAMLIGLLPAEQVFAASGTDIKIDFEDLGFTEDAKGIVLKFNEDTTKGTTYKYDGGTWTVDTEVSLTMGVDKKKDAANELFDGISSKNTNGMSQAWYNNVGDASSSFYTIYKENEPVTWSLTKNNRNNNILLTDNVVDNEDSLVTFLETKLGFTQGEYSIYATEAYWVDTKVDSSNREDWFSHSGKSWYYQRIRCDYSSVQDLFVYTFVGLLQFESKDNLYIVAQYTSKDALAFGTMLYDVEGEDNKEALKEIKNFGEKIGNYFKLFFNSTEYIDGITAYCKNAYILHVAKESAIDEVNNPVITINDVLKAENGTSTGAPWVNSAESLEYFVGTFISSYELSGILEDSTIGANFEVTAEDKDGAVRIDIKFKYDNYITEWGVNGNQLGATYIPPWFLDHALYCGRSSHDCSHYTTVNIDIGRLSDSKSSPVILDNGTLQDSELAWGTTVLSQSMDESTDRDWFYIVTRSYCQHTIIVDDEQNFIFNKSGDKLKIKEYSTSTNPDRFKRNPFWRAHVAIINKISVIDYKSNTGVRVSDALNNMLLDGKITVKYTPNVECTSTLNWRNITEVTTEMSISTASDLVYLCAYLWYLSEYTDSLKLNTLEIITDDGTYEILYSEEAKSSFGLNLGYFYKESDSLGTKVPFETGWTYVDEFQEAFGKLSMIGLVPDVAIAYKLTQFNNKMFILVTGEEITSSPYSLHMNVDKGDVGAYEMFGYTSDEVDKARNVIDISMGTDLYTGCIMGALVNSQHMYIYSTQKSIGQIGDSGFTGIPYYNVWEAWTGAPYKRSDRLEGTDYKNTAGAEIDYVPRLPYMSATFPTYVYTLLYNIDYAASVCDWSDYSDETGIDVSTMTDFLYGKTDTISIANQMLAKITNAYEKNKSSNLTVEDWAKSGVYDDMSDDYMGILKAIVSIHDLCDLLYCAEECYSTGVLPTEYKGKGVDIAKSWSPAIYGYYMIYQSNTKLFEALSANLVKYTGGEFSYSTPIEPLGFVIKFEDEQLSAQWKYGYALSAMYVPFQTNVYEVAAIEEKADEAEWVTNFYYKYGFYRKALYITTDPDAVVNRYTAGIQSGTKVATLRDLLNYNRDIELYVDQGFYNGDLLEEQLDRFIQNTNEGSVFGSIYDACNLTPDAILKDGGYATYSSAIQAKVRPFGYEIAEAEKEEAAKMFAYEDFILSEDEILGEDGMLSAYEYSIQQPYGLVSAMYRSGTLFNKANQASVQNEPVFVSSKNANAIGSYNKDLYRSFYNYLMLSAMEETIERETTLLVDLDAPIFIDIFGNILTSDGYVIIPAAANPTLVGEDWVPYTLGFATYVNNADPSVFKNMTYEFYDFLYGINYAAAIGKSDIDTYSPNFRDNQKKIGGGYFFLRQNGTSTLGTTNLTDGVASTTVNWDNPNTHVAALKNLLFSVHYLNTADMYSMTTVNMILEVLRGAPIEFIDYTEEGITTTHALTKGGATVAYMSEQLLNSVQTDSNGTERNAKFSATLNVLDLFHIESAEKVALLAVKLLLIGFLILLAVQIIADASVGKMPVKTVGRIIVTCVLTGTCISLLPVLTEFSLSKLTQMFLQPEAAELLAMQAQRDSYGIEIGITESYNTESSTDIIVKVGELDVQWYDLLLYSVYSSIDDSFTDLYTEAADGLPLAEASYTFTSGKNIYMDLGKIMDSTVVQYNGELGLITNERTREMSDDDMSASYLFPYYVFLDQLVANVNLYNKTNGVQPLSYNINSDGSIRTQDMTYAYFHSTEFMTTDYDILDLYRILNINTYKLSYCPYFSDDDLVTMGGSLWYPTNTDTDTLTASVELLYQSARDYVANNSSMLSYVSDGAFLKSLAMYLAVEYNSIFGVGTADAFELKCVDTKDMLRYVVSHPKDVYKYATRSFSRYAFEVGDVWGAILATALYVIMCVTNAIKVVAYVLTYVTAVWSIIYHRVFKRESDYSVYGFFILIGEITILNVIYSASLKVMMNLTRWGMPGLAALGVSILLQGGIIIGFLLLCFNGVKNVKNLGQKEIHRIQTIINNLNSDRSSNTNDNPNQPERTVAVLQAHDFSRRELDNYNGDRANVADLLAHDRRREMGQIGQEATES